MRKVGRNEKCPCGSGNRHKDCCINKVPEWRNKYRDAATLDHNKLREDITAWNILARYSRLPWIKKFFIGLWEILCGDWEYLKSKKEGE